MAVKKEHLPGQARIKGTMIHAHLGWLQKRGIDPKSTLPALLSPEVAKAVTPGILATEWVPLKWLVAIDRALAAAAKAPPDDVFRELGRHSAVTNLTGVYSGFVSDEPHRFFEKQTRLHSRFQDFGESVYSETGARSGRMVLSKYVEYSPVFCLSAVGYYQGALETMKAPGPIRVVETECTCAGADACSFTLSW
jgi:uncharacterized protein (TIGR02265 family)